MESKQLKLYDPKQYGFVAFFFSLVPVFIMSFSNTKQLPHAVHIRNRMKIYTALFALLIIVDVGVLVWASVTMTGALQTALENNPKEAMDILMYGDEYNMKKNFDKLIPDQFKTASSIVDNSGTIFFVSHLILLIAVVRFTSQNEIPLVQALKEKGEVQFRRLLLPILAGIIFGVLFYFGVLFLIEMLTSKLL